jgi:hypothetical protein
LGHLNNTPELLITTWLQQVQLNPNFDPTKHLIHDVYELLSDLTSALRDVQRAQKDKVDDDIRG